MGGKAECKGDQHRDRSEECRDPGPVRDLTDDRPAPCVEQQAAQGLAAEEGLDLGGELGVARILL